MATVEDFSSASLAGTLLTGGSDRSRESVVGLTDDPVGQKLQLYERLRELRGSLAKVRDEREYQGRLIEVAEESLKSLDVQEGHLRAEFEMVRKALGI